MNTVIFNCWRASKHDYSQKLVLMGEGLVVIHMLW